MTYCLEYICVQETSLIRSLVEMTNHATRHTKLLCPVILWAQSLDTSILVPQCHFLEEEKQRMRGPDSSRI
jgi:hypothetical protein